MHIDIMDGYEIYSPPNILGILPRDWEKIKKGANLFTDAGRIWPINWEKAVTSTTTTWIEDHKWEHTYACVLNWQTRTELKFVRQEAGKDPAVQDAAAKGKTSAKRSKNKAATPAASLKSYADVNDYIHRLEDMYPFRSILGNSNDRDEVDLIYDDIVDEVVKNIDLATRNS